MNGIKEMQSLMRAEDNVLNLRDKYRRISQGEEFSDPVKELKKESKELLHLKLQRVALERGIKQKVHQAQSERVERLIAQYSKGFPTPEKMKKFAEEFRNIPEEARLRFWVNAGGVFRTMQATADISAYLRQGLMTMNSMAYNPQKWGELGDIVGKSLKSFWSQRTYDEIMIGIKENPYYEDAIRHRLALTDVGGDIFNREEEFISSLAEKIPGIKEVVKASNRNMGAVLNMLRMAEWTDFMAKHGDEPVESKRAMANYINVATGRGNLAELEQGSFRLAQIFFSPKFAISRYQLATAPFIKQGKDVNKLALKKARKDWVKLTTTALGVMGLASLHPDVEVGMDPSTPDFGRMVIGGSVRIDILGGLQGPIRQMAYGLSYLTNGAGITDIKHRQTPTSMVTQSLTYKLSPNVQVAQGMLTGEDWKGDPQPRWLTLMKAVTPITNQELIEAFAEDGFQPSDLYIGLNYLGVGVSKYD